MFHVHAHRQRAVGLRIFQAVQDFLFIRVGFDDLDHLRAGGQNSAHFLIAAHTDADAGTGLLRALRHGHQIQMAERRGHKGHAEILPQETERGIRLHRADHPAFHQQGIHIFPRDLYGIAFSFTEHTTAPLSLIHNS